MSLTPKVRAFIALSNVLAALRVLPSAERAAAMPVAKRLAVKPGASFIDKPPADLVTTDHDVDGLRVRSYRTRPGTDLPLLVYLHGGGWTVGGLAGTDHICARLAHRTGSVVVAVEYRLAPEHPYPAPLDDCEALLRWALEADLGIDPARIAVGGDSAGGNLAAALALRARDAGIPLRAQVLVYPAVDATRSTPSAREYDGAGLSAADLQTCWRLYAGGADPRTPEISPLLADDLGGLPPTLVLTAGHDPLHDEGLAYAARLLEAGVPTTAHDHPDYLHGFFSVPRLYAGIESAWQQVEGFLLTHLAAEATR